MDTQRQIDIERLKESLNNAMDHAGHHVNESIRALGGKSVFSDRDAGILSYNAAVQRTISRNQVTRAWRNLNEKEAK